MAKFEDAIDFIIFNETGNRADGGYTADPTDLGGETKYGISKAAYPNLNIKDLTLDQAKDIYKRDYWLFDGLATQAVATKIFDAYVMSKHAAIKVVQAIVGSTQDGFYGANTEAKVNAMDPVNFLSYLRVWLVQHYQDVVVKDPTQAKFLTGWISRVNRQQF